jgi:hypothetical protein
MDIPCSNEGAASDEWFQPLNIAGKTVRCAYLENTYATSTARMPPQLHNVYALRMQKAVRSAAPREGGRISALLIAESRGKNEGAKSFRMRGFINA